MGTKTLESALLVIDKVFEFLESSPAFLSLPAKDLRKILGKGLTAELAVTFFLTSDLTDCLD